MHMLEGTRCVASVVLLCMIEYRSDKVYPPVFILGLQAGIRRSAHLTTASDDVSDISCGMGANGLSRVYTNSVAVV